MPKIDFFHYFKFLFWPILRLGQRFLGKLSDFQILRSLSFKEGVNLTRVSEKMPIFSVFWPISVPIVTKKKFSKFFFGQKWTPRGKSLFYPKIWHIRHHYRIYSQFSQSHHLSNIDFRKIQKILIFFKKKSFSIVCRKIFLVIQTF